MIEYLWSYSVLFICQKKQHTNVIFLKFLLLLLSHSSSFAAYTFLIRDIQDDGKYRRWCLSQNRYRIPRTRTRKHLRTISPSIFAGVFKFPAGPMVMAVAGSGNSHHIVFRDHKDCATSRYRVDTRFLVTEFTGHHFVWL